MAADGTIPEAPKLKSRAGRAARNASPADTAAAGSAAVSRAGTSPEGADKAPTPFYDLLTSMIDAHALENGRARQSAGATGSANAIVAYKADTRGSRGGEVDAIPPAAGHTWRMQCLSACVVGLVVAIGGVVYVSEVDKGQPPVVAADEGLDGRSGVIGSAKATDKPVERPLQAGEPDGSATIGVEEERTAEAEIVTRGALVAHSDDRPAAAPVVEPPSAKPASGAENRAEDPAEPPASSEAPRADPIASGTDSDDRTAEIPVVEPPSGKPVSGTEERADDPAEARATSEPADPIAPAASSDDRTAATALVGPPTQKPAAGTEDQADDQAEASSEPTRTDPTAPAANAAGEQSSPLDASSSAALARDNGSAADRTSDPVATHVAKAVSGVNMRAGPSNDQAVLAAVAKGSPVKVIECRQWCEVIFDGQRGWIYKRFIAPLPPARGR